MALANAIQAATRPSQIITWTHDVDNLPEDLTGATLTGKIIDNAGTVRAIDGVLTVTTPSAGVFTWAYGTADVATDGRFSVQFTATFSTSPTVARTMITDWRVLEEIM